MKNIRNINEKVLLLFLLQINTAVSKNSHEMAEETKTLYAAAPQMPEKPYDIFKQL